MRRLLYIAALVLFIGYLVWPYGTLLQFYLALKAEDETQVERMVNWPSVQTTIENEINRGSGKYLAQALLPDEPTGSSSFELSYGSLSIAGDIAAQLATPKTFIFLFRYPDKIYCIVHVPGMSSPVNPADCDLMDPVEDASGIAEAEFRGPNFARLYEKTHYLFFTDPFTFRFDVQHEDVRLDLTFARMGLGWKLVALK